MIELFQYVYKNSKHDFFQLIEKNIIEEKKQFIITANPEIYMQATKQELIYQMLKDKDVTIIADGEGVVKGCSLAQCPVKEKIAGVEVSAHLLSLANHYKKSLYVFGCTQEVLNAFQKVIKKDYPNISIKALRNGYDYDEMTIFEEIQELQPDIILVALGVPRQELLIYKHYPNISKGIFVGVGGSIDVISNTKKRAPNIWIHLKLEWLYRILKEPKRWRRFYNSHIKYICLLYKEAKRK